MRPQRGTSKLSSASGPRQHNRNGLRSVESRASTDQLCRLGIDAPGARSVAGPQAIADFLDDHAEMIETIRGNLRRGLKNPDTGRNGLTAQQVLRSLILMRIKNWDYRELRERIADGYTLRQFTGFYCQPVPEHDAFQRAFVRLTPETLQAVNGILVQAAVALRLEDGKKLRVDTTVVQTDVHHPTDNTLLWDVVRVVTRLVGRLADMIERRIKGFHNRTRAALRRMSSPVDDHNATARAANRQVSRAHRHCPAGRGRGASGAEAYPEGARQSPAFRAGDRATARGDRAQLWIG